MKLLVTPVPVEAAAAALSLHAAPMYFYRKGKGRYKAAPEDNLKAALAAQERNAFMPRPEYIAKPFHRSIASYLEQRKKDGLVRADVNTSAFAEVFTTRSIPVLRELAERAKIVFKLDTLASIIGLGYIIGLRYAAIIAGGIVLAPRMAIGVEGFAWGALGGAILGPLLAPWIGTLGHVRVRARVAFDRSFLLYFAVAAPLMFGVVSTTSSSTMRPEAPRRTTRRSRSAPTAWERLGVTPPGTSSSARNFAKARKSSFLATKSVSQLSSTSAPSFASGDR